VIVLLDLGRGLREAFYMFWETLWALVLGFGLSGAVQAFVSKEQLQRRLGDHGPASVARASVFGMVSSSCSYAAAATARSLFVGGADFLAALVFMFASTNLVIELGIVLLVLVGWQFLAAEFVGGALMIVLLVLVGSLWLRGRALAEARSVAEEATAGHHHHHGSGSEEAPAPWRARLRSVDGWTDAARSTMDDVRMLRRELLIGFVVAGLLTVVVPAHVWNDVFVTGHGFWTSLENAVVGPFVALVSFVCSIGNVPLAAALWKGGSSFGGVVAFVFADLVTFPLLLVYRKQYGGKMALRLLGVFWAVMTVAGLATEYLFRALGWVPSRRPAVVAPDSLRWGPTTALDIVALGAFAVLYVLSRRAGPGEASAAHVCEAHAPTGTGGA
jgi:uncharacterized membrane protein YraQ (UPF0718 family)